MVRSRWARGKSERAARLVLLVEAAAAAAPPDGPSASHRLWVTDTHSEGGEGTSRRAGRREGTGQGHHEGR